MKKMTNREEKMQKNEQYRKIRKKGKIMKNREKKAKNMNNREKEGTT